MSPVWEKAMHTKSLYLMFSVSVLSYTLSRSLSFSLSLSLSLSLPLSLSLSLPISLAVSLSLLLSLSPSLSLALLFYLSAQIHQITFDKWIRLLILTAAASQLISTNKNKNNINNSS